MLLLALVSGAARAQTLPLADDFGTGALDPVKWSVVTAGIPQGGSGVFVLNQACVLQNRGHLVSKLQIPTSQPSYRVRCQWTWMDAYDRFHLLVRSNGIPGGPWGETQVGVELIAGMEGGSSAGIGVRGTLTTLGPVTTTGPGVTFLVGTTYTAELWDLGTSFQARVEGPGSQWWEFSAPVLGDTSTLRHVVFHNREQTMGSHQCHLDNVSVVACGRSWQPITTGASPGASFAGMTYDESIGKTLLFGGDGWGQSYNSTWTYDGVTWTQLSPATSPSIRVTPLTYDSWRQRAVLFGGWGGGGGQGNLGDLWEWNGTNWLPRTQPGPSPQARCNHMLAFDRARGRVVLFGGRGNQAAPLGDTWEWNGTSWTQPALTVSPRPRWMASMAYDEVRARVLLVGGADNQVGIFPTDTWTWDGTQWQQQFPATLPTPRAAATMVHDRALGRTILFGGEDPTTFRLDDAWEWDGTNWEHKPQALGPVGRWSPESAYDGIRKVVVLYGGITNPGSSSPTAWLRDTWERVPAVPAASAAFGAGCPGPQNLVPLLQPATGSLPRLGFDFTMEVTSLPIGPITVPILLLGSSNTQVIGPLGPISLPLDLTPLGWPGCWLHTSLDLGSAPLITTTGQASHSLSIPSQAALAGFALHTQAIVLYTTGQMAFTNGLTNVLGY